MDSVSTVLLLGIFCLSFIFLSAENCFENTLNSTSGSDVIFSTILTLRERSDGERCGAVLESQLQLLAALQWTVEKLNEEPDLSIGFRVYDDCGSELLALEGVQQLYSCRRSSVDNQCQNTDNSPADIVFPSGWRRMNHQTFCLIGLSFSLNSLAVINTLNKYDIPVVSPLIHAADSSHLDNFRLTRPPLSSQAKVVVDLLTNLSWSHVLAVYTDDAYGKFAIEQFKQEASSAEICVEVIGHISVEPMSSVLASLNEIIRKIQISKQVAYTENLAVVFYGTGVPGREFVAELKSVENITLIVFDSVEETLITLLDNKFIPANTIMVRNPNLVIEKFDAFFSERAAVASENSSITDSLDLMMKKFYEETSSLPENITDSNRNYNVFSVINAVVTLAEAYKQAKSSLCSTCNIREEVASHLKDVPKDAYMSLLASQIPNNGFDFLGYNLSVCSIELAQNKLMCSSNQTNEILASLPKSHCKGVCSVCHHHQPYQYAYIDGEVLILGLFSVHEASSAGVYSCGRFQSSFVQSIIPETFLYGVELIRRRTGIQFGALVLDSCQSPARVMLMVSKFMSGDLKLTKPGNSELIDPKNVRLAVGASYSGPTLALATLLTEFSVPLVSYSASTPDLDDRLSFPYFLRTVPSDDMQTEAMVQIIKRMQWQFVGLMYVDNNYGRKGKRAFLSKAKDEGVCVTDTPIALQIEGTTNENLDALSILRFQRPDVIVLIMTEVRLASFLEFLKNQCERSGICDNFIFLASEAWGNSQHLLEVGGDMTLGSISLQVGIIRTADHTFYEHLLQRTPHSGLYNPWFNSAWMEIHQCSLNDTDINKPCPYDALFPSDIAKEWSDSQRTVHLINAVLAIGQGMAALRTSLCLGNEAEFPCQEIIDHPEAVVESVQSARLFTDGVEFRLFDETGNGQIGFDIFNIQRSSTNDQPAKYVMVGTFNEGKLIMNTDYVRFYRGDVSAQCTDDICALCQQTLPATEMTSAMTSAETDIHPVEVATMCFVVLICIVVILYGVFLVREKFTKRNRGSTIIAGQASTTSYYNRRPAPTPPTIRIEMAERYSSEPTAAQARSTYLNAEEIRVVDSHIYDTTTEEGQGQTIGEQLDCQE